MILLESPSQCFMTKSKPWQLRKITLLSEDCNMCVLAWIRIATTEMSYNLRYVAAQNTLFKANENKIASLENVQARN